MASRTRPTMAEVAAHAGVSQGSVSKALGGRRGLSDETRERVLAAAAELGYRPTARDAAPVALRRRALAIVFDLPASPYILGVMQGVLAAAASAEIDLLVRTAPPLAERTRRGRAVAWAASQRTAGVIGIVAVTLSSPDALLDAAAEARIPFVMVDPIDTRSRRMVSIGSSNWAAARDATQHLLSLGHRRIAWIGGPETSDAARDRFLGYQAALSIAGIPFDDDTIREGLFTVESGIRHARDLLGGPFPPTAIMCANDDIAVGTLQAAYDLGVRVPDQLSVTGFDDTPQAAWTIPRLTSVHQPLEEMGRMAVDQLLSMAAGNRPPSRHVELTTSLTVRGTTGPAPQTWHSRGESAKT